MLPPANKEHSSSQLVVAQLKNWYTCWPKRSVAFQELLSEMTWKQYLDPSSCLNTMPYFSSIWTIMILKIKSDYMVLATCVTRTGAQVVLSLSFPVKCKAGAAASWGSTYGCIDGVVQQSFDFCKHGVVFQEFGLLGRDGST